MAVDYQRSRSMGVADQSNSFQPDVLVVDDDQEFLEEIVEGLDSEGITAVVSPSVDDALDLLRESPAIRVVVTDVHMPRGTGLELLQRISAIERPVPPVAIVITGRATVEHAVTALRLNAVDFLRKPLSAIELAMAIRRARALVGQKPVAGDVALNRESAVVGEAKLSAMIQARVERDRVFGNRIFPDPTWKMMLDLKLAEVTGRKIAVTTLCHASGASHTTALRRLERLETLGLAVREQDQSDLRRHWVRLTERGREEMNKFLCRVTGEGEPPSVTAGS